RTLVLSVWTRWWFVWWADGIWRDISGCAICIICITAVSLGRGTRWWAHVRNVRPPWWWARWPSVQVVLIIVNTRNFRQRYPLAHAGGPLVDFRNRILLSVGVRVKHSLGIVVTHIVLI